MSALLIVAAIRGAFPAADQEQAAYLFVTTFGYGHLLGASLLRGRRTSPDDRGTRWLRAAWTVTTLATLYAAFTGVVAAAPWIVMPMLYLSLWHIVENDVAFQRGDDGPRPGPLPRSVRPHLLAASLTGLLAVLAARAAGAPPDLGVSLALEVGLVLGVLAPGALLFALEPRAARGRLALVAALLASGIVWHGAPWVQYWEVFTVVTCFHLVEWLLVMYARARASARAGAPDTARRLVRRTLAIHLPAVFVCATAFGGGDAMEWLRGAFAPAGYLLFSLVHVVHTAAIRFGATPTRLTAARA